jgi:hypothetical protein
MLPMMPARSSRARNVISAAEEDIRARVRSKALTVKVRTGSPMTRPAATPGPKGDDDGCQSPDLMDAWKFLSRMSRRKVSPRTVRIVPGVRQPTHQSRGPFPRRAAIERLVDSRTQASGHAKRPHDAPSSFGTMPATRSVDTHRIPDPSPSRRCAAQQYPAGDPRPAPSTSSTRSNTSTLTVGRGGERPTPQDSTAPPRLPHVENEHPAQIPQNLRSRESNSRRPTRCSQVITGSGTPLCQGVAWRLLTPAVFRGVRGSGSVAGAGPGSG